MLVLWLCIAVALTVVGAGIAVLTQEGERQHEEELEYEDRIETQRAEIEVARCEADPTCRGEHEKSAARLREHRLKHAA